MLRLDTDRSPAREELRGILGDSVVHRLMDASCGRILGVVFHLARVELERTEHPGQLELDAA
jgi:hypothetical protein